MSAIRFLIVLALLLSGAPVAAQETTQDFSSFLQDFAQEAQVAGISPAIVQRELASVSLDDKTVRLDHKQPEHTITFSAYQANILAGGKRVQTGVEKMGEYCQNLRAIERTQGVPARILIALWGSESDYGRFKGNSDVLQSLLTLAYAGRAGKFIDRPAMFRANALAALQIIAAGRYSRASLKGSYAGAFGHHQFMPESFLKAAMDGDGDGRADMINNPIDSFASAANLLRQKGWQTDQPILRQVSVPVDLSFDGYGIKAPKDMAYWQKQGIRPADGKPFSAAELEQTSIALVVADRASREAYLFYANAQAIWRWNNSSWFVIMTERVARQIAAQAACSPS